MYSIMEKKPKARNMESTTRISVMAAGEASDIESAAVVPTGSPKYFGPRNANRAAGSTSSAGLTGDASFQIVSILKFFLRRILAEVWTSTAPMPQKSGWIELCKARAGAAESRQDSFVAAGTTCGSVEKVAVHIGAVNAVPGDRARAAHPDTAYMARDVAVAHACVPRRE